MLSVSNEHFNRAILLILKFLSADSNIWVIPHSVSIGYFFSWLFITSSWFFRCLLHLIMCPFFKKLVGRCALRASLLIFLPCPCCCQVFSEDLGRIDEWVLLGKSLYPPCLSLSFTKTGPWSWEGPMDENWHMDNFKKFFSYKSRCCKFVFWYQSKARNR